MSYSTHFCLMFMIRHDIVIIFEFRWPPYAIFLFFIIFTDLNFSLIFILHSCMIIPLRTFINHDFLLWTVLLFHILILHSFISRNLNFLYFFYIILRPHVIKTLLSILPSFIPLFLVHQYDLFTLPQTPRFHFWKNIREQIADVDCDNW